MKLDETLLKAADMIGDQKDWTQGTYARNKKGLPVPYSDAKSVCFCASGAIAKVSGVRDPSGEYSPAVVEWQDRVSRLNRRLEEYGFQPYLGQGSKIAQFNDDPNTTHDQVLQLLLETAEEFVK